MPQLIFTRAQVMRILGDEAGAALYRIEHDAMDFGTHHVWHGGQQWFTAAGVELLVDQLRPEFKAAAMALQREGERELARLQQPEPVHAQGEEKRPWYKEGSMA